MIKHYKDYIPQDRPVEITTDRKGKFVTTEKTIYTLDIETTSYFEDINGQIHGPLDYPEYNSRGEIVRIGSCMYIWMFGVNDQVYYGRTYEELEDFMKLMFGHMYYKSIIWVHNLSFEFEFLQKTFDFKKVFARKSHKPMWCESGKYPNLEFRCSLMLSNSSLEGLTTNFNLGVEKASGDLDYNKLRTPATPLTDEELYYCEMDCVVLYHYIKHEKEQYKYFMDFPRTSTGKVRTELKNLVLNDETYVRAVKNQINTEPEFYNILLTTYMGGYTHASRTLSDEIWNGVTSYDFTSSYPYVLVSEKYPCERFRKVADCEKVNLFHLNDDFSYIMLLRFDDIHVKTRNTFISTNKLIKSDTPIADNGRLVSANSCELWVTDCDWEYIKESYGSGRRGCEPLRVTVKECYTAQKDYLPRPLIEYILKLYKNKTVYKGVSGKEGIYNLSKALLNSIYGMMVTNDVRAMVDYKSTGTTYEEMWNEREMTGKEISKRLIDKQKEGFLNPAWGVYCSAYARRNLLMTVIKLDEFVAYCDTDSMKLIPGFDKQVISEYNTNVARKLRAVSDYYSIPYEDFSPVDSEGEEHLIGPFDFDGLYAEFITLGAKKYAVRYGKGKKVGKLEITVAGVPKKKGVECLNGDLNNFEDGLRFPGTVTGKLTHFYCENMPETTIIDYLGNQLTVCDRFGVALMPCDYVLGISSINNNWESTERNNYD